MAYTFKSIADVDVVAEPAETANVLIEEDGVIKKAPKTAVGGGGSETVDMIITISQYPQNDITADTFFITEGSVDAVFTAVSEGRIPNVKVRHVHGDTSSTYGVEIGEYRATICLYGERLWMQYIALCPYGDYSNIYTQWLSIGSDGTLQSAIKKTIS